MKNLVFKMKSPGSVKNPGSGDEATRRPASTNSNRQRPIPIEDKLLFVALTALVLSILREVVR